MTKYYTGTGDDGTTGLLGDQRVPKNHPRIQTVGAIDEATAAWGMARSHATRPEIDEVVKYIQLDLYKIMSALSVTSDNQDKFPGIQPERVDWLEEQIERFGKDTEAPQEFILPGDTPSAAAFALARTITRRAERNAVQLYKGGMIKSQHILAYMNRLSSLAFVLELYELDAPPSLAKDQP